MMQRFQRAARVLREAVRGFIRHKDARLGASLAFYTLLSLSPLLVLVLAILGPLFGAEAARGALTGQIEDLVGSDGAKAIAALVANADHPSRGILSTLVGLAVLLFGASSVFVELNDALDDIWETPAAERPPSGLIRSLALDRLLAFAMIAGIALLLLAALIASAVLGAVGNRLIAVPLLQSTWATVIAVGTTFALTTALFAMIFRLLPDPRPRWRHVLIGAVVTSFLFLLGRSLIGVYLGRAAVGSAYGAAGSLVVLLVWVYYSTQILLFGAEVTCVIDRQSDQAEAKV